MEISGHEMRSIFERYNIVDQRNIRLAVEKIEPQETINADKPTGKVPRGSAAERRVQ